MALRIFGISIGVTVLSLVGALWYGGWKALALAAILGVLEVSLSFDNAVLNATILQRMSEFWQRIFLTVGVVIAVFGMRLVFPLAIVWVVAGLDPVRAFHLALNPPTDGSQSYEQILLEAHPQIAAFGGAFLLMLFLNFLFADREVNWLRIERILGSWKGTGRYAISGTIAAVALAGVLFAEHRTNVWIAGGIGIVVYVLIDQVSKAFSPETHAGPSGAAIATGKAGFFLFLYLEVLDASFSFDGVIGAFAITSDPIIIAIGLGVIGAMFVRSITVYLVRKGTLGEYRYLEHGAHWAIGALAAILLFSIGFHVNEVLTGLVGIVFIGLSFVGSVRHNRRARVSS